MLAAQVLATQFSGHERAGIRAFPQAEHWKVGNSPVMLSRVALLWEFGGTVGYVTLSPPGLHEIS